MTGMSSCWSGQQKYPVYSGVPTHHVKSVPLSLGCWLCGLDRIQRLHVHLRRDQEGGQAPRADGPVDGGEQGHGEEEEGVLQEHEEGEGGEGHVGGQNLASEGREGAKRLATKIKED